MPDASLFAESVVYYNTIIRSADAYVSQQIHTPRHPRDVLLVPGGDNVREIAHNLKEVA